MLELLREENEITSEKLIVVNDELLKYVVSQKPLFDGIGIRFKFPNGYGASVVKHQYSYGVELAVLGLDDEITYDTSITGDVLGHLTPETLYEALVEIKNLEV